MTTKKAGTGEDSVSFFDEKRMPVEQGIALLVPIYEAMDETPIKAVRREPGKRTAAYFWPTAFRSTKAAIKLHTVIALICAATFRASSPSPTGGCTTSTCSTN